LQFRAADDAIRVRVRDWRASRPAQPRELDYTARIRALVEEQASLHAAHLTGLSWPERYGGSGLGIAAEAVLAEELAASGTAELIGRLGLYMVGPTLMDFGTPEQCERFLPGMLDASELWCQGFSEPEAGSDRSAIRTRGRSRTETR
jgi:alkylation response protein AidB-like acyl-CoA dehydrogenase